MGNRNLNLLTYFFGVSSPHLSMGIYTTCLTIYILNFRCVCKSRKPLINKAFLADFQGREGLDTFYA